MSRVPYFAFYPADFMNGVRGLTPQEVGVYTMILCRVYEESGPVEYHVRRLATYCGMREATFASVVEKLVDLDKLQLVDGKLFNRRAGDEIQKRSDSLRIASAAGKASAEKRQQKQGQAATPVEPAFNHTDTDTDTDKNKKNPPPSVSTTGEKTAAEEEFLDQILRAVGHDPNGDLPEFWVDESAGLFIADWRGLGLADAEIIVTAKATRRGNPAPPNGPKALDKAMRAAAKPKASQASIDAGLAAAIAERKTYLLTHVTRSRAEELISAGLVTADQCQAAGVL